MPTGLIANLLGVSRMTVHRWAKLSQIRGVRVNSHLRVPYPDVLAFARESGLPTDRLTAWATSCRIADQGCPALLCVTSAAETAAGLARCSFQVTIVDDLIQAGQILEHNAYAACVVDGSIGRPAMRRLLTWLQRQRPNTLRAVIAEEDDSTAWGQHGAQVWERRPVDQEEFGGRVWRMLNL